MTKSHQNEAFPFVIKEAKNYPVPQASPGNIGRSTHVGEPFELDRILIQNLQLDIDVERSALGMTGDEQFVIIHVI